MKKIIILFMVSIAMLTACKKELKEIGIPASKMDGIKSTWQISKAVQVDEISLIKESADITRFFTDGGTLPNITFSDSTYTVDTVGLAFNFFGGVSGKWFFNDPLYPNAIKFQPNGGDPFELTLGGPIRPIDNLKFSKPVYTSCKGKSTLTMSYILEFKRKN